MFLQSSFVFSTNNYVWYISGKHFIFQFISANCN
jgi:hypothetical protein